VCVWERERERERESCISIEESGEQDSLIFFWNHGELFFFGWIKYFIKPNTATQSLQWKLENKSQTEQYNASADQRRKTNINTTHLQTKQTNNLPPRKLQTINNYNCNKGCESHLLTRAVLVAVFLVDPRAKISDLTSQFIWANNLFHRVRSISMK
jgi:hypothetical protein